MRLRLLVFVSFFLFLELVQAVTVEVKIINKCSGGIVARIVCENDFFWRCLPKSQSYFFLTKLNPGDYCYIDNLWAVLAFSFPFVDHAEVKVPKNARIDSKVRAEIVFENLGMLNVCKPRVSEMVVE